MKQNPSSLRLMSVVFAMTVALGAATVGAMALAHAREPQVNPFAAFANVFPAQSGSAVEAHGFSCDQGRFNNYDDQFEMTCVLEPVTGVFARVVVLISGDAIQRVTFLMRKSIRVGDLEMHFKTRSYHGTEQTIFFSWQGSFGSASMVADREGFSLFRQVWQVNFSDKPLVWHIKVHSSSAKNNQLIQRKVSNALY